MISGLRRAARIALVAGLALFYVHAAAVHAERVNWFKARADQSGYLYDAKILYENWHAPGPPRLLDRNRMPVYGAFLALFHDPTLPDADFFVAAKRWTIRLSLVLLGLLHVIFAYHLPPLAAANVTLVVAFGYFIFRAGYVQAELVFYFLFFVTFVACCHLLRRRPAAASLRLGALAGGLAGLTHLTKAAMLPFVTVFLLVYALSEAARLGRDWKTRRAAALRPFAARAAAGVLMVVCFLAVLYPYISNSKRVFGRYFYNVNTTFYVWYDNWPQASVGTYVHGDHVGSPKMPAEELPGLRRYLREHSVSQIARRVGDGLLDLVSQSYQAFWYLKFVVLYTAFAAMVVAAAPRLFVRLLRERAALFLFLLLYAATYGLGTAFYAPVSGTGTARFLQAHVAPLLFVLSCFLTRPPFRDLQLEGVGLTPAHFQWLISATVGIDLVFTLWPRLMTTYGGF